MRAAALLFAALLAPSAYASEGGLTAAPILNRPVGARSSGMGRAFTAVTGDPENVMYNPAGLAFAPRFKPYASYMNGTEGGGYGFVSAPFRSGAFTLAPSYLYYSAGSMSLNLSDGTSGRVIAESDTVAMLSGAVKGPGGLAFGATLKRTSIELAETASASSVNYDIGAALKLRNGLSFGAAAMNNGRGFKFEEERDPAPAALRAGAAYGIVLDPPNLLDSSTDITYCALQLSADWSRVVKEKGFYQAGLEIDMRTSYSPLMRVRAGYQFDRADAGVTFGLGLKKGPWSFDFGFETSRELTPRRPVSVSYEF